MSRAVVPWKPCSANRALAAAMTRPLVALAATGILNGRLKHSFAICQAQMAWRPRVWPGGVPSRGRPWPTASVRRRGGKLDVLVDDLQGQIGRCGAVAAHAPAGAQIVDQAVEDGVEREVIGGLLPGLALGVVGKAVRLPRDRQA